jgi:hypothetical protein
MAFVKQFNATTVVAYKGLCSSLSASLILSLTRRLRLTIGVLEQMLIMI